ncbi:prostamide/prostaglandin F synthase-like [Dysidea avara]|uniref:prostamide/prostaglandin F synthase-like n=1 Tax=Dysidea avara TaxID=196820 RepID=UPI0033341D11
MASGGPPEELKKISKNLVVNARTNEVNGATSKPIHFTFFVVCPTNGINLVAVGLEQLGVEEFIERKFFDGEIFIDEKKQCYKDLGFKTYNICNVFCALLSSTTRNAIAEAKASKIDGNFAGDGFQNGGLLIVSKGGKQLLLNESEEEPGEHVPNIVILQTLKIKPVGNITRKLSLDDVI